ncbi:hypothetical protein BKI52_33200 [marine bacterium AO1-C]|nr:hypothetical protein BKI52_33200 [marine bacterium AO1-C]
MKQSLNTFINHQEPSFLTKLERKEPWVHLLFWVAYFIYPLFKFRGLELHVSSQLNDLFFGMVVFYSAYLFFFPSTKKQQCGVLLLVLYCIVGYGNFMVHNWIFDSSHQDAVLTYTLGYLSTYLLLILFAYTFYSVKDTYQKQMALKEANQGKIQAELASLKAQINPHFLFNTLNSIYYNALQKDDKTPEMILKLSDNFRYLLQEGQNEQVAIRQEVAHLRDYISLQEERLANKVNVQFEVTIDNPDQMMAPLMLISFIENAFKYTSLLKGSNHLITISLTLEKQVFDFACSNPFRLQPTQIMDEHWQESGVGIRNTQQRLQYVYPDSHQLHIDQQEGMFWVHLQIML